jgi:CRISPR-associated Csx2 family protein
MTTLISLLGKAVHNYRTAKYAFDEHTVRTEPFFGMALLAQTKPDRLILAGTVGSMWDVFFDHQHTDDEATLALIDAVASQTVSAEILAVHEQRLTQKLGIPVQCLLISYARNEAEQTTILTDLAEHLAPGEKVILDVTHGFRHLPMLALVAARYLARVRGVQVQEVFYGALEMTDPVTGLTPVLRLSAMLQMLDWIDALAVYESSGNYGVFAPLLQHDGMQPEHANLLAQAAYFERIGNPVQAKQSLSGAHKHVRDHQGPLGQLFKTTLTKHIGWFRHGSRADWELALADRYLARQDYLRAITYLCEAYISRATEKLGSDVNTFEDRKRAFDEADKNQDVWLLKHLRNAMAHGVLTDNRDAKPLLQDQKKLDDKLHALRKTLFR